MKWRDGRIEIEPAPAAVRLQRRGRLLVAMPPKKTPALTAEMVEQTRSKLLDDRRLRLAHASPGGRGRDRAALGRQGTPCHCCPCLAEAYAVLTRMPAPHRLAPADALALLEGNFTDGARVIALDAEGYRSLLKRAARDGVSGGRIYDAIIAECAVRAQASALLTFNALHFQALDAAQVRIVVPSLERGKNG